MYGLEYLTAASTAASETPDAFVVGVALTGVAAIIVGLILLVGTVVFAMRGQTMLAIVFGCALLTLILGIVLMLIIAVIVLIYAVIVKNPAIAGQVFGGWLLGTIIVLITGAIIAALGVSTL